MGTRFFEETQVRLLQLWFFGSRPSQVEHNSARGTRRELIPTLVAKSFLVTSSVCLSQSPWPILPDVLRHILDNLHVRSMRPIRERNIKYIHQTQLLPRNLQ